MNYELETLKIIQDRGGCLYCLEDGTDPEDPTSICPACDGTGQDTTYDGTDGTLSSLSKD